MRGLEGKAVLVTGAASGIGRAIAQRLGSEGAAVGILDLNGDGAQTVAGEIGEAGGRAHAYTVDITDYAAVVDAVTRFEGSAGPVSGLVNNAGWDLARPFVDTEPELWKKVVEINLFGPLNVTHVALRGMVERGAGRIVTIASDAGRVGSSGEAVYSAAKGGMAAFMKTLAREHARAGLTFNTVCPGPTDTPLLDSFDPDGALKAALERAIPMRRLGQPDDYPGIVTFLLSDDAAFITGQTISVSGGLSMSG